MDLQRDRFSAVLRRFVSLRCLFFSFSSDLISTVRRAHVIISEMGPVDFFSLFFLFVFFGFVMIRFYFPRALVDTQVSRDAAHDPSCPFGTRAAAITEMLICAVNHTRRHDTNNAPVRSYTQLIKSAC